MFDYIEGKLEIKTPARAVVDVQGVGYDIVIPCSAYQKLPALSSKVRLFVHFHVNENAQQLFGFADRAERELFRVLIGVNGIGPKTALAVLSGMGGEAFKKAVISGDLDALQSISGVGRKTAERLIVELREKLVLRQRSEDVPAGSGESTETGLLEDSLTALQQLGYRRAEAGDAVRKVFQDFGKRGQKLVLTELVRESLKRL